MKYSPVLLLSILCCCSSVKNDSERIIKKHIKKVGNADQVQSIIAQANCMGPEGAYQTTTESSFTSDYLLFKQTYTYKDHPFFAAIYSKKEGYGLDSMLVSQGPLSHPIIAVLKAHEFHELMLQVKDRYYDMKQGIDTTFFEVPCHTIKAVDHLGYPVRLYFNKHKHRMEGFSQANPYEKGEIIQVHFEEWSKNDLGLLLFEKITILQGAKEYSFDYSGIEINAPSFEKLTLKSE